MREEWIEFVRARLNERDADPEDLPGLWNALSTIVDVAGTSAARAQTDLDREYAKAMGDAMFALMYIWKDHPDYPPNRHGNVIEVTATTRDHPGAQA